MPTLSRRKYAERQDCWHVHYGDVHVGTIARRAGCPVDVDQWEWICGFYPGMGPGEHQNDTAATFEAARGDFEAAWQRVLPTKTDADFQAWRDQEAWTERKYAMWERGERLPSQVPNSLMRCPCGEVFDTHKPENTILHVPHITESHEIRRRQTAQ